MVLWRLRRPFRTNTPQKGHFHYRGLEWKSRKSRNSWSNRQIWPWNMEWSREKANRDLPRQCPGHSKQPLPKTGEDCTQGHHHMVNTKIRLIIFFAAKDGEALYNQQKTDLELTVAQIMSSLLPNSYLNWKKVGKTTRPFRYHINQIPYDYTVEVRNRFKGLDLIDRVPDELWNEVRDIVQETGMKTIPMEKKCKKAKWLFGEALQIAVKRREVKSKGEKERYKHLMQSSKE